jgi:hypothetical protein
MGKVEYYVKIYLFAVREKRVTLEPKKGKGCLKQSE